MKKTTQLKNLLNSKDLSFLMGAHNGLSAKIVEEAGFQDITIQKEKVIRLPDDILSKYLNEEQIGAWNQGETGIFSITVYAEKPGTRSIKKRIPLAELQQQNSACAPGTGCC